MNVYAQEGQHYFGLPSVSHSKHVLWYFHALDTMSTVFQEFRRHRRDRKPHRSEKPSPHVIKRKAESDMEGCLFYTSGLRERPEEESTYMSEPCSLFNSLVCYVFAEVVVSRF